MGKRKLRAIDLYSGVGGWSLGLTMAGIKVVRSYEKSPAANTTNRENNRHSVRETDIRELALEDLPSDIDIVVGSPPCTQFSYANRGGNGDLVEGLEDVRRFLEIVDYVRPEIWAMENVPRVAGILAKELTARGKLRRFRHLAPHIQVFCLDQFGLPQRRKRCIAGNFNVELFKSYCRTMQPLTLGEIVEALAKKSVVDPIYRTRSSRTRVHDHEEETALSVEEIRINRAAKTHHPIYNAMPFPDRLDAPSRTVTATCTRVGRESIVIADDAEQSYRRLTIRERASLQSFPINFQFYSPFHREKIRLIGNAMPPLVAFYLGQAFREIEANELTRPREAIASFRPPIKSPPTTKLVVSPDRTLDQRRFKFAIPSLHLKSGVRFELANILSDETCLWRIQFFYGTSKDIRTIPLTSDLFHATKRCLPAAVHPKLDEQLGRLHSLVRHTNSRELQSSWARTGTGSISPLDFLDNLSEIGRTISGLTAIDLERARKTVVEALNGHGTNAPARLVKLINNAPMVAAGILIGCRANELMEHQDRFFKPDRS